MKTLNTEEEALKKRFAKEMVPDPLDGHENRFEQILLKAQPNKNRFLFPQWIWIAAAAAVVVGFIVVVSINETNKQNIQTAENRAEPLIPEVEMARAYYAEHAIDEKEVIHHTDEAIVKMMNDLRQLEKEYKKLDSLLQVNYSNERIVAAMVENYQFRLRIAQQLRKYIEIKNQTFTPQHETTSNS
jgi:hypothetical protein